jgi:transcriptional repressor NrdR
MRCPYCGFSESKVIDSRPSNEGSKIRRRRECISCAKRFTTYEEIETFNLVVIKKDKTRVPFDRSKLIRGILKACEKRPIPTAVKERLAADIEAKLLNSLEKEISSSVIGEYVMEGLRNIDHVAYVRFASVYREFTDVKTFIDEIASLGEAASEHPGTGA